MIKKIGILVFLTFFVFFGIGTGLAAGDHQTGLAIENQSGRPMVYAVYWINHPPIKDHSGPFLVSFGECKTEVMLDNLVGDGEYIIQAYYASVRLQPSENLATLIFKGSVRRIVFDKKGGTLLF